MSAAHRPLADRAYAETKELILTGALPGGTLISEGEIAERLQASRTPVREAFLRLQAEDLLQLHPKRGAVVTATPVTEVDDVLDVRLALETAAVQRVVGRPDMAAALVEARRALDDQGPLAGAGDLSAFSHADERFHRAIVTAAGNAIATRFYASLADRQRRMLIGSLRRRPAQLTVVVEQHAALLDRIEGRDAEGFTHGLRAHLDETHR